MYRLPRHRLLYPQYESDDSESYGGLLNGSGIGSASGMIDGEGEHERCCFCYDPVLCPFYILNGASCTIAFGCSMLNCWLLAADNSPDLVVVFIRIYSCLFGILVIFVEIDCRMVMDYVKALEFWSIRGLFYLFVGVLTLTACKSHEQSVYRYDRLEEILGSMLCLVGIVYFLGGICCFHSIKEKRLLKLGLLQPKEGAEGQRDGYQAIGSGSGSGGSGGSEGNCGLFSNICPF